QQPAVHLASLLIGWAAQAPDQGCSAVGALRQHQRALCKSTVWSVAPRPIHKNPIEIPHLQYEDWRDSHSDDPRATAALASTHMHSPGRRPRQLLGRRDRAVWRLAIGIRCGVFGACPPTSSTQPGMCCIRGWARSSHRGATSVGRSPPRTGLRPPLTGLPHRTTRAYRAVLVYGVVLGACAMKTVDKAAGG